MFQVVVNFVVPFTVIPLTKFLSSEKKMGPFRLSKQLEMLCWFCSAVAIFLNMLALYDFFSGLEIIPVAVRILLGTGTICVYLYLTWYLVDRYAVRTQYDMFIRFCVVWPQSLASVL